MKREEILEAAKNCVTGRRAQDYGSPERNFGIIAAFWETYLSAKCVEEGADVSVNPEDVANMMCLFKLARLATGTATQDSYIDLAGYAACGGELNLLEVEE